jgi:hypothetical protein
MQVITCIMQSFSGGLAGSAMQEQGSYLCPAWTVQCRAVHEQGHDASMHAVVCKGFGILVCPAWQRQWTEDSSCEGRAGACVTRGGRVQCSAVQAG